jgi:hypothetical protein
LFWRTNRRLFAWVCGEIATRLAPYFVKLRDDGEVIAEHVECALHHADVRSPAVSAVQPRPDGILPQVRIDLELAGRQDAACYLKDEADCRIGISRDAGNDTVLPPKNARAQRTTPGQVDQGGLPDWRQAPARGALARIIAQMPRVNARHHRLHAVPKIETQLIGLGRRRIGMSGIR